MHSLQQDIDERTSLTKSNKFELLLFRLGSDEASQRSELFGINVLKVREIVTAPTITAIAGTPPHSLGVVRLRDQVLPVFDLPAIMGHKAALDTALMLVTEYARTTQAFMVDVVEDIVRLDWNQVVSAEASGTGKGLITSIARMGEGDDAQLAQVLDVEAILQMISPRDVEQAIDERKIGPGGLDLEPGAVILVADDSFVARSMLEKALQAMDAPFEMVKTGKEAWDRLGQLREACEAEGRPIRSRVGLVLTDLEMPEMDGFTLTRNIKQDPRLKALPVIIHSSLSGFANEEHVRSVGADGYVAKFSAEELADTLRRALPV